MSIFAKQLICSSEPSAALTGWRPDLIDAGSASALLAGHFGFGGWKITFPGEVRFSAKASEIFGLVPSDEAMPLEVLVQCFHADDRGRLLALIATTLQEMRALHAVLRVPMGDGSERIVETIADLRVQDGRVTELFGLSRDISREARKEALAISRNRLLQDMISSAPVPIAILDERLNMVDCSPYWLRCHKMVDRSDVLGRHLYELFPGMPPALREENERALRGDVVRTKRNYVNPGTGGKMECHTLITRWMTSETEVGGLAIVVGWHELGVAASAQKAQAVADFDGTLLDLLKEVS